LLGVLCVSVTWSLTLNYVHR